MDTLADKVVLIVGAESDVGAATAKVFARHAASLVLCGTSESQLSRLAQDCRNIGLAENRVLTIVKTDLNDEKQMEDVVNRVVKTFNFIHSLIYLRDDQCTKTFETSTVDDLNAMHACHVESPLLWTQRSLPHLKLTKGNVVLLSSGYSRQSVVGAFPYALAKAAEDQLVRVMSLDLAGYGIRVNAVCPLYENEKSQSGSSSSSSRDAVISSLSEYIAYLSTDAALFITGQCVTIGDAFKVDAILAVT